MSELETSRSGQITLIPYKKYVFVLPIISYLTGKLKAMMSEKFSEESSCGTFISHSLLQLLEIRHTPRVAVSLGGTLVSLSSLVFLSEGCSINEG